MPFAADRVRAILFDIDGTLSDTDDHMVKQLKRFFSPLYRDKKKAKQFARWLVMSIESPGNLFYNLADRFALDSLYVKYMQRLTKKKKHKIRTYWLIPGVQAMLEALNHFPLGIVSARDARTTRAFLEQFNLMNYFDVVVTSQTCHYTKPFPDPMLYAAQQLNVPVEQCLMVGDTTVDIKAAKLAGMQAAGVLCGFGRERELKHAGANVVLPTTVDIVRFFA